MIISQVLIFSLLRSPYSLNNYKIHSCIILCKTFGPMALHCFISLCFIIIMKKNIIIMMKKNREFKFLKYYTEIEPQPFGTYDITFFDITLLYNEEKFRISIFQVSYCNRTSTILLPMMVHYFISLCFIMRKNRE